MKKFKQHMSVVLSAALALTLVPLPPVQAKGIINTGNLQDNLKALENLHDFSGTENLIKEAADELKLQGVTFEEKDNGSSLEKKVKKESKQSLGYVKSELATRFVDNAAKGKINVKDLKLSKKVMAKVVKEVLYENYLYNAITDVDYETEDGKVETITFHASEGYRSAQKAMNEDASYDLPTTYEAEPVAMARTMAAENGECARHTVDCNILGDANKDNSLDAADITAIRQMIVEGQESKEADADKNGKVNVKDIAAIRKMIADGNIVADGKVDFKWEVIKDFTPIFKTNDKGQLLDQAGNVTDDPSKAAVLNGGLIYNPETKKIEQGILPDVYWGLSSVSFKCAKCGEQVNITRDTEEGAQALDSLLTRYEVYLDLTKIDPETQQPQMDMFDTTKEQPKTSDTYVHYTQVSVAQFADDSFEADENGQPVKGFYVDSNANNNDNGVQKLTFYYSMLSAFNADNAEYYGVSADYWTSMNSEANPMAALKSLCNIDPETNVPPAAMGELVQMLPQAFMSYVYYYGDALLAMRDQAMEVVNKLPAGSSKVKKLLVLHDWIAENTTFDMGTMVNVTGGDPETDPIQMTPFGSMLSQPLREMGKEDYYGCICLGYSSAYAYLIQNVFPELYKDGNRWLTPEEVNKNGKGGDMVDFGQVTFYSNTANTSVAGEGFGGGYFNNVHYYNMIRVDEAPTSSDKEDQKYGKWFFTDVCYDDIYVECLTQYRAEADGSMYHDYLLVSPQTMGKQWANAVDSIDNLYDGYKYVVKTDENGNPVPYPESDTQHFNPDDPNHPQHEKVVAENETFNDNRCYEDSWFSGAQSKISNDGKNWYYVDSESSSTSFADKLGEDGRLDQNLDELNEKGIDFAQSMHSGRVDVTKQNKLKSRPMSAPDYWEAEEKSDDQAGGMMGGEERKKDTYAKELFDYGTGKSLQNKEIDLSDAVKEDFVYRDQFPGLTHGVGLYNNNLYFNLANNIYKYSLGNNTCELVKSYGKVHATNDGRLFQASGYKLDSGSGEKLPGTIEENEPPIAGLTIKTVYHPEITQQGEFKQMHTEQVMTVNLASNVSFTAAFTSGMTEDQKAESRYTKRAVNFNPEYSKWLENQKDIQNSKLEREKNGNGEFLWCANIREDIAMTKDLAAITEEANTLPCAGKCDGHNFEYNASEGVYICKDCQLSARNIVADDPEFDIELASRVDKGISKLIENLENDPEHSGQLEGMEIDAYTDSVYPAREAAVIKKGEIEVKTTPKEGTTKVVTGVAYVPANSPEGTEPTVVRDKNKEGNFVIKKGDNAPECMEISLVTEDEYTVTVEDSENGKVTAEIIPKTAAKEADEADKADVPAVASEAGKALAGDTVKLTVAAAEGYELDTLTVKPETSEAIKVTDTEDANVKTFVMPAENVTVTATFKALPKEFTVTYTDGVEDAVIFEDVKLTVKENDPTPAFEGTLKRDGYTFTGWDPEVADKVTTNVTYTAQWKENEPDTPVEKFKVTYTDGVEGEEIFADQVYEAEKDSETPAFKGTPTRDGYTFKGWNPEVADKVTGEVIYTAQWEKNGTDQNTAE